MQDSVSNRTSTSSLLHNDHLLRKENNDDHLLREDINRRSPDQSLLMSRGQSMAVIENHQEVEEGVMVMETSCRFCGNPTWEEHVHFQLLHPVQVCSLLSF